jgi:hypothetical protein
MLLDSDGEPFAQTGYQEGGPAKYLAHLGELRKANTPKGKAAFAQGKKDEVLVRGYGDELEKLLAPHLEKKDLAGAEASIAKFLAEKKLSDNAKFTLMINARVGSVQACKPGDTASVLKVIDDIIAQAGDWSGLAGLKDFRAQVAAAQAPAADKK